jgi:hypothetical protein
MSGAKVLILDIETAPIIAHCWGLWENNVGLNQIVSDWHLLAFCAKWRGEKEVVYADQRGAKSIEDDRHLLEKLWALMDNADIIVTQNGVSFDIKKINARFILNGFKPPSPSRHLDTKIIAKAKFGFTSNRLEYLSGKLNKKYKKLTHRKYPGHELWNACLRGDVKAWDEMRRYNIYDVLSTEELFEKLYPWYNKINFSVYSEDGKYVCGCGSTKHRKQGFYYSDGGKFQRYRCKKCGTPSRDKRNLLEKDNRPKRVALAA